MTSAPTAGEVRLVSWVKKSSAMVSPPFVPALVATAPFASRKPAGLTDHDRPVRIDSPARNTASCHHPRLHRGGNGGGKQPSSAGFRPEICGASGPLRWRRLWGFGSRAAAPGSRKPQGLRRQRPVIWPGKVDLCRWSEPRAAIGRAVFGTVSIHLDFCTLRSLSVRYGSGPHRRVKLPKPKPKSKVLQPPIQPKSLLFLCLF